jgi:hypothetical protein
MNYKPFSLGEIKRLEKTMSEERRAALEIELEEKIQERTEVMDEWIEGYMSFDAACELSAMLTEEIAELTELLNQ